MLGDISCISYSSNPRVNKVMIMVMMMTCYRAMFGSAAALAVLLLAIPFWASGIVSVICSIGLSNCNKPVM